MKVIQPLQENRKIRENTHNPVQLVVFLLCPLLGFSFFVHLFLQDQRCTGLRGTLEKQSGAAYITFASIVLSLRLAYVIGKQMIKQCLQRP